MEADTSSVQQRLADFTAEIAMLRVSVEDAKKRVQNGNMDVALSGLQVHPRALVAALKRRKLLMGHAGRVHALDWAGDSEHLLSAR
jgi:hypothetical protein